MVFVALEPAPSTARERPPSDATEPDAATPKATASIRYAAVELGSFWDFAVSATPPAALTVALSMRAVTALLIVLAALAAPIDAVRAPPVLFA